LQTLYQRVLGDRFSSLQPGLQAFLAADCPKHASGSMQVVREKGWFRNRIASLLGIPPAGRYETHLEVLPWSCGERWLRHFNAHTLETRQRAYGDLLLESSGPGTIGFELAVDRGGLLFRCRRAWLVGVRIPLWLAPQIEADNRAVDPERWSVSVRFSVLGLGQIAKYEGEIRQFI
jgi:hypothetical protein